MTTSQPLPPNTPCEHCGRASDADGEIAEMRRQLNAEISEVRKAVLDAMMANGIEPERGPIAACATASLVGQIAKILGGLRASLARANDHAEILRAKVADERARFDALSKVSEAHGDQVRSLVDEVNNLRETVAAYQNLHGLDMKWRALAVSKMR